MMQPKENVSEKNANSAKPYYSLGKICEKKGEWEEAIANYQKAIDLAPNWAEVRQSLAEAKEKMGGKKVSESSNPNDISGKVLEEKEEVKEAIEIEPRSWEVHHKLGNSLQEIGSLDDAVVAYKKSLELNADFRGIFFEEK